MAIDQNVEREPVVPQPGEKQGKNATEKRKQQQDEEKRIGKKPVRQDQNEHDDARTKINREGGVEPAT
jgi:hypothetical protein